MANLETLRKFLYILMTSNEPCTGAYLSSAAGISLKSFQNTVNDFNKILEDKNVEIVSYKGKGYSLVFANEKVKNDVRREIVDNFLTARFYKNDQHYRINEIMRNLMIHEKGIFLSGYALDNYYSESTVSRDIKLVKDNFKEHGLKLIHRKNAGFVIEGNEHYKRNCLVSRMIIYRNNIFLTGRDEQFENIFEWNRPFFRKIKAILNQMVMETSIYISSSNLDNILWWVVLGKTRSEYTDQMQFTEEEVNELTASDSYQIALEIYQEIADHSGLTLEKNNVLGLTAILDCYREDKPIHQWLFDGRELMDYMNSYYPGYYQYADDQDTKDFLENIQRMLDRVLTGLKYRIAVNRDFLKQIQINSVSSMEHVILLERFLKTHSGIDFNDEVICNFYFICSNHIMTVTPHNEHTFKTLLVSGRDRNEAECLMAPLTRSKYLKLDIDLCDYLHLTDKDMAKYDFVIRNGDFALPEELKIIDVHYQGFYLYPQLIYQGIPFGRYIIQQLISEDHFYRHDISSKNQAMNLIHKVITEDMHMPEQYYKEIEEREAICSSERNNQIVYLKSFSSFSDQDVMSVIVSNEAFKWHETDCKMIIIDHSSISSSYDSFKSYLFHKLIRNYKDLSMAGSLSYDSFIDILYEGMIIPF